MKSRQDGRCGPQMGRKPSRVVRGSSGCEAEANDRVFPLSLVEPDMQISRIRLSPESSLPESIHNVSKPMWTAALQEVVQSPELLPGMSQLEVVSPVAQMAWVSQVPAGSFRARCRFSPRGVRSVLLVYFPTDVCWAEKIFVGEYFCARGCRVSTLLQSPNFDRFIAIVDRDKACAQDYNWRYH